MHMKKNVHGLYKWNKVLGLLVMIMAVTLTVSGKSAVEANHDKQEAQEYKETGGEIVTIFRHALSDQELKNLMGQFGEKITIERHIDDYALLSVKECSDYLEVLETLKADPQVAVAQGNAGVSSLGFSNDTYADTQWAINNDGHYTYLSEAGREDVQAIKDVDMDVVEAWAALKNGVTAKREVVVAVIDTGVDYQHPDLAQHMWTNPGEIPGDNIDNDNNGYVDDVYGWDFYNDDSTVCHYKYSTKLNKYISSPDDNDDHGTHVAGIIGAAINNGIGIAGVASQVDVKIMSLKINGGPKGTGSLSRAIEAVKYATMMGADICNLSWGTTQYTAALKQAMKESDMLFIAAAGNTGDDNSFRPIYPASLDLDNLISVTFIDSAGELTGLSNYGADSVDLAAPGEDIFSTTVGSYAAMSGSSMAAPQVSGVAALMYACSVNLYAADVKKEILDTIKPLPDLEGSLRHNGIPNAYQALLSINQLTTDWEAPVLSFETLYDKSDMIIPITAKDKGPSGIRVLRWSMGDKKISDFSRGTSGNTIEDNKITVSKTGVYTFYSSDYAGNEAVQTYLVLEDITPPKITSTFSVADNYSSRTITVRVSDLESRMKRMEYMEGKHHADEFLPATSGVELDVEEGKATIKVKKDGVYSIFAIDYRGNMSVKQVTVKTVKSTKMNLSKTKYSIQVGDEYTLRAYLNPTTSTDQISFTSSDEGVATVTVTGKIKARRAGTAVITVRTSSGLTATCTVKVRTSTSG